MDASKFFLLRAIYIYFFEIISNATVINTTTAKKFVSMYNSADEELNLEEGSGGIIKRYQTS